MKVFSISCTNPMFRAAEATKPAQTQPQIPSAKTAVATQPQQTKQPLAPLVKDTVEIKAQPKTEAPKADVAKVDAPKTDAPKVETVKTIAAKAEEPKAEAACKDCKK